MTANTPAANAMVLKPCPFCGGRAEPDTDDLGCHSVRCMDCTIVLGAYSTAKSAAVNWNRRPVVSPSASPAPGDTPPPFPNFPGETLESMAEIGEAFMDAMPGSYSWCQSPAEVIADLQNKIHDLEKAPPPLTPEQCEAITAGAIHLEMNADDCDNERGRAGPVTETWRAQALALRQLARGRG
jgi:hypothetical protein